MTRWFDLALALVTACGLLPGSGKAAPVAPPSATSPLVFEVTSDMRDYTAPEHEGPQSFEGACRAIRSLGPGAFMVSPGDIDPPDRVRATLDRVLGKGYVWYAAPGNHETSTKSDMTWLRKWGRGAIPNLVRRGPPNGEETTYAFEYGTAHFIVLNQFYDGRSDARSKGDVRDLLYAWLATDLAANRRRFTFVFGHLPFVSLPDEESGRVRHENECLDRYPDHSQRFQALLKQHRVTAYVCGHTHNFSCRKLNGIWQIDAGHARGKGDKGSPSTFLRIQVAPQGCWLEAYRDDRRGGPYRLARRVELK